AVLGVDVQMNEVGHGFPSKQTECRGSNPDENEARERRPPVLLLDAYDLRAEVRSTRIKIFSGIGPDVKQKIAAASEEAGFSVGAASCRDDRGWKPLPHCLGRPAPRTMTCFHKR
ncbi:MAG TPA: hypothetical protein VN300_04300, partial [Desulfobacterales bacterium]|nr:hypothetical protein [Desulfobacterales bacterium]